MNLTWHIVKKDLRALRWPIGVWFACIIAKLGIGVLLLNASGTEGIEWFNQMDFMSKALAVGELLSFVLVAALIQELRRAGVLIGAAGAHGHVLKIRPPLRLSAAEADLVVEAFDATLTRLEAAGWR